MFEQSLRGTERLRPALLMVVALLLGTVLSMGAALSASAHDRILSTDPADGAVLSTAPAELTLVYSGNIIELGSEVQVLDDSGQAVSGGTLRIEGDTVVLSFAAALANGEYQVNWRVVSSDGHPIDGRFAFEVAAAVVEPEPAPEPQPEPEPGEDPEVPSQEAQDAAGVDALVWVVIGVLGAGILVGVFVIFARRGRSGGLR